MIFVTVGTQLPFERLIEQVDAWAAAHPEQECFAQIGQTKYRPTAMEFTEMMTPKEYQDCFNRARVLVSHVGMGTIISGLEAGKPLILMPRRASLGEHRSDHQLGSARKFAHHRLIQVVENANELDKALLTVINEEKNGEAVELTVSSSLIAAIKDFVNS